MTSLHQLNDQQKFINELLEKNKSISALIEKNKVLADQCHFLDAEYTKRKVVLLQDNQNLIANLSTSYGDTAFWKSEYENAVNALNRQLTLNKQHNEDKAGLKATIIDLSNTVDELKEEVQRLSILAVSSSTVVKDASENKADLTQSEIDFLKSYLSFCLTEAAEDISLLKGNAKRTDVQWYSNELYKMVNKIKKKAKVLSGIQSKLKKTVLNRKVQTAPQVNKEAYDGHKRAWIAVCDVIEVYYPKFLSKKGTGIECAVRAVHTLGKEAQRF